MTDHDATVGPDPSHTDSSLTDGRVGEVTGPAALPASVDAMRAFAELGQINLAERDLGQVLARVAELAKQVIAGAVEVSVTLVTAGVAGTAASTGDLALALDERQYDAGYGPCLDAAATETVHLIVDMAAEQRWPAFTADALRHGAHSSLSVGIPVHAAVSGAINIYADQAGVFDDDAVALGRTFAGYAAVAMANANLYSTTAALAEQMTAAMASRAVIEQAKGILIAQQHLNPDEAFDMLSRASQAANRKLRDIAQAIVDKASGGSGRPAG